MDAENSKLAILNAAEQRFSEFGYEATRLEDIAADIGIGRTGVLYHFSSKHSLYTAVLEHVYGDYITSLGRALVGGGTLTERIEKVITVSVDGVLNRPSIARMAMREALASDPELISIIRAQAKTIMDLLNVIFEEGEKSGELTPIDTDPYILISSMSGTLMFYVSALPTLFGSLPYDHMAPERFELLKKNILNTAKHMLGIKNTN